MSGRAYPVQVRRRREHGTDRRMVGQRPLDAAPRGVSSRVATLEIDMLFLPQGYEFQFLIGAMRVLVVDDGRTSLVIIRMYVELLGGRAFTFADPQEALERAAETYFDYAVVDLNMPKID